MRDRPDAAAILDIVAHTLSETLLPHLRGGDAYQARIAANLVRIVAREMRHAGPDDREELQRLRSLLNHEDGDLLSLNRELATRIASGEIGPDEPSLVDHLWRTTIAKLAVDQPYFPRLKQLGLDRLLAHDRPAEQENEDGVA